MVWPYTSELTENMENIVQKLKEIEELLLSQRYDGKEHLDVKEASIYLNLSTSAIYKMTSRKEIPHYIPGGKKIYFNRSELDSWIKAAKVPSTSEFDEGVSDYLRRNQKQNF